VLAAVAAVAPGAGAGPALAADADPCTTGRPTSTLIAEAHRRGVIDLHFFGAQGAPVTFFECAGDRALRLGERSSQPGTLTDLWAATAWRCERLTRRFAATATLPGGTPALGRGIVRTVSCAHRFDVAVPRRVMPGALARVRIADRWGVGGVRATLCVTSPLGGRNCRAVAFRPAAGVTRRFRATARGRWQVELRVAGLRTRATVAVGVPAAPSRPRPPTVLATGDSTIGGIDSFLSDDLGDAATVVSDARPGISISQANDPQAIAVQQVERLRPRTTVMSIGANEGWPMIAADGATHECCDAPWVQEYARRVRALMTTYRRGGAARVLWLTLPAPRDPRRVVHFDAVNRAILSAGQGLKGVRVLRMDRLFTPHGYRDVMHHGGRTVRVRAPDGIHLSIAGTRIAAREIVRALRGQAAAKRTTPSSRSSTTRPPATSRSAWPRTSDSVR